MSELNKRQDAVIEEFSVFDDWMDKYSYLIDLGKELHPISDKIKNEQTLIKGCQSKVWLDAKMEEGKVIFTADSDAIITKGIVALLVRVMSGLKPEDIINGELYFIDRIGLHENLSPTRSNGLVAMVKQMKMFALAYHTKLNS
ncbi:MAG: Fe-S metabolism protein SufE [Bacteroidetes bacterium HGW-Bacteroidetes-4]|jgi:cysteine desulfuration protein SufE|nr:MAG: Fe-S metabolism protein SufE [Bacteroidetes bacterium HGW-Bacteroidetes-4]